MSFQITTGFLDHNGGQLYWEAAGAGSPVVLIHGITLDRRMWDDQFSVLAQHHRVIRYDARGYGKSSPPSGPYRPYEDLAALLDAHEIARAALVGEAMGGGIAINLALDQPERVERLVLISGVVNGRPWSPASAEALQRPRRTASEQGLDAAKEEWLHTGFFAPAREHPGVAARLQTMVGEWSGWGWLNPNPLVSLQPSAWSRLAELQMPLLYILGERDVSDFHEIADRLTREAPQARCLVVPGVGILSNMEAPDMVNRALLEFLDGND
jgi:pimeloyl-ACP methyl ester carboxylesterase